jgi:virginiamycin B lyase
MKKILAFGGLAVVAFAVGVFSPLHAQSPVALNGQVTSAEEGPMEGVLVSAKKSGSTVTITVVSDAQGNYSFPAAKLEPGRYSLRIRAIGYDLDRPANVDVGAQQSAKHDLKLRKTEDLAAQLSNGEWLASFPGTDQQKNAMLGCVGCHTLERVARSTHKPDDFINVALPRMQGYVNQSIPAAPQLRRGERRMEERGDQRVQVYRAMADFLGSINLSAGPHWNYALKTLPRPKGRSTRVVITEYDLPRETIQPHDVVVDADGIVWYSSFGEQFLGRLDPKTGEATEYPVPMHKPGFPTGFLGLRTDKAGDLWLGNMYQATIVKFERKTQSSSSGRCRPSRTSTRRK